MYIYYSFGIHYNTWQDLFAKQKRKKKEKKGGGERKTMYYYVFINIYTCIRWQLLATILNIYIYIFFFIKYVVITIYILLTTVLRRHILYQYLSSCKEFHFFGSNIRKMMNMHDVKLSYKWQFFHTIVNNKIKDVRFKLILRTTTYRTWQWKLHHIRQIYNLCLSLNNFFIKSLVWVRKLG